MKRVFLSLGLVWLTILGAHSAYALDGKVGALFASDALQPSEATIQLIERMFRGQMAPVPMAHQQSLDRTLISRDWPGLEKAIAILQEDEGPSTVLDWLATRHVAGYLAASSRYALYSFDVAEAYKKASLKETGVMLWFYLFAAIQTDGHKCADRSAPGAFLDRVRARTEHIRNYAASLPVDRLRQSKDLALFLEEAIAPNRATDPVLCAMGMASIQSALNAEVNRILQDGVAASEIEGREPREGEIGRQIQVPADANFRPGIKPTTAWQDAASEARAALPDKLERIIFELKK